MKLTIVSHAGLLVENSEGKQLLFDPWLFGSCYWRSWWNYPPPSEELLAKLKPDVVYLTHIHWDHFHGPSLKKYIDSNTQFVIPSGNFSRIQRDLKSLGFHNVIELQHGASYRITDNFKISSYQFYLFLDSAAVVEVDGMTLLNLNDCKHMGLTLKQIVKRHRPIDFVFRSHSSANSRLSYQLTDKTNGQVDDIEQYIENFSQTVRATKAKYAIPFASNHCHLHKDVYHFNDIVQTPEMVADYFKKHQIDDIQLVPMVSGDSWSIQDGFALQNHDWFSNRKQRLQQYAAAKQQQLEQFYLEEENAVCNEKRAQMYFKRLAKATPYLLKRRLKNTLFCYVLFNNSNTPKYALELDLFKGQIRAIDVNQIDSYPIQIHTSTFIFNRCMTYRIFSHLAISKRVTYKLPSTLLPKMQLLNLIFNLEEYEMIPLSQFFSKKSIVNWLHRYREIVLYLQLLRDKVLFGSIKASKYLKPIK